MLKFPPLMFPVALTIPTVRRLIPSTLPDTDRLAPKMFPVTLNAPGKFKSPVLANSYANEFPTPSLLEIVTVPAESETYPQLQHINLHQKHLENLQHVNVPRYCLLYLI
jgi:hypothetical protein